MDRIIIRKRNQTTPSFGGARRALIAATLTTVRDHLRDDSRLSSTCVARAISRANLHALRALRHVYPDAINLP